MTVSGPFEPSKTLASPGPRSVPWIVSVVNVEDEYRMTGGDCLACADGMASGQMAANQMSPASSDNTASFIRQRFPGARNRPRLFREPQGCGRPTA